MPRYTLRVPEKGDALFGDGMAVVADTIEEARRFWEDETGERLLYMHSHIGRCRIVYARDIEDGDCHEDAEPGDTTLDYLHDDGRALEPGEVRVWEPGAPRPCDWRGIPTHGPWDCGDIPIGTSLYHPRLRAGRLLAKAWKSDDGKRWCLLVRFEGRHTALVCSTSRLGIDAIYGNWRPPERYRLEVDGELVATTRADWAFSALRDMRETRLRNEWEARHFAQAEAATIGALA